MKPVPLLVALLLLVTTGCFPYMTRPGGRLEPVDVVPAEMKPTLEHTVDFFNVVVPQVGYEPHEPSFVGRRMSQEIFMRWRRRGYIESETSVESAGDFTGQADYNLTLSGHGSKELHSGIDLAHRITAGMIPLPSTDRYRIQCTLENVRTGEQYSAAAEDSVHMTSQLLLVFALPWADRGWDATMDAIADHLYQQLKDAGAFGPGDRTDAPSADLQRED